MKFIFAQVVGQSLGVWANTKPENLKPVILTAYLSGMRHGEIISLNMEPGESFGGVIDALGSGTYNLAPRAGGLSASHPLQESTSRHTGTHRIIQN